MLAKTHRSAELELYLHSSTSLRLSVEMRCFAIFLGLALSVEDKRHSSMREAFRLAEL